MPRKHISVRKRHRQSVVRRGRNRTVKSNIRSSVKTALTVGQPEERQAALKEVSSVVDKAAAKGVIHKNRASRIKSRLARKTIAAK